MLVECVAGFIVGVVARYVIPDSAGIGADTLFGIVGGGVGAFVYKLFGHKPPFDDYNIWSIASAVVGAVIFILVIRSTAGRRTVA
jgi:uncharacterized membrane protein YeaQ/YmgE (transglycosylase-associated protein family)